MLRAMRFSVSTDLTDIQFDMLCFYFLFSSKIFFNFIFNLSFDIQLKVVVIEFLNIWEFPRDLTVTDFNSVL